MDEIESQQRGIQETITEARQTLTKVDDTLIQAEVLTASIERSTENWLEAGEKWEKAVSAFDAMVEGFSSEPDGGDQSTVSESFDIKDYSATAERAEAAAAEFRMLTSEVRALLESNRVDALGGQIVWRLSLIFVLFFGTLLVYRIICRRLLR
jgi:hypothetical protein